MSFLPYPKYKASGVQWLGNVPAGWEVRPLKTIALGANTIFIDGDWIESKDISTTGIRYLTSGNVGEGTYKEQGQGFISDETFKALNCIEVLPGDVLISRLNLPIGRACIVPALGKRIVTCVDNVIVRPSPHFNRKFCVFLLSSKAHFENMENLGRGATMPRISRSALGRIQFAFPPLTEQTAIAEFLDRETAKIDELVAEQRRLMELLKEKRQAVISHAVTKGLNPDAPMKPSGIEWLGDVPAGWEVKKIKFVTANIKAGPFGSSLTKEIYVSSGYRVYGQEQVIPNDFTIGHYYITEEKYEELAQYRVAPSDILVSCVGTFGKIALVPSDIEPGIINPRLIRLRCTKAISPEYLVEVMRSNITFDQFSSFSRGGTMDVINIGTLKEIFLSLPPLAEQEKILRFIRQETAKFDTLTAEAQGAIDLLQERRTALISAAVTGQIDVRKQTEN